MKSKMFKLNKAPYAQSDVVRVYCSYEKNRGGYCAYVELVEVQKFDCNIFGKCFCAEYYKSGGDGCTLIEESKRRNARKEEIATDIVVRNAKEYAEIFLETICERL